MSTGEQTSVNRQRLPVGFHATPFGFWPGLSMGGYLKRQGPAEGTHDGLLATAAVFGAAEAGCVLLSLDLVAITTDVAQLIRAGLAGDGFAPERVLVAAIHTHAGPGGEPLRRLGEAGYYAPPVLARIVRTSLEAVRTARAQARPAELLVAEREIDGLARNRYFLEARAPVRALLAVARASDGQPLGAIACYAAHPTVLGETNRLYSADYVGVFRRRLSARLDGAPVLFLNGAAGDLSTRGVRRASSFEEVDRLGSLLADQFGPLLAEARPLVGKPISGKLTELEVAARDFPRAADLASLVAARRREYERLRGASADPVALRTAENDLIGAEELARMAAQLRGARRQLPVQALRLGELRILGVAGELFSALGERIRERAPAHPLAIACYANSYLGYILPESAQAAERYEALVSWVRPDTGSRIVDAASDLLSDLGLEPGPSRLIS